MLYSKENRNKFVVYLEKFVTNKYLALIFLLAALGYGIYFMQIYDPLVKTLSRMGSDFPPKFMTWGALTGLAFVFNSAILYKRVGFSKTASTIGFVMLGLAVISLAVTCSTKAGTPWHMPMSAVFAATAGCEVIIALTQVFLKKQRFFVLVMIYYTVLIADLTYIVMYHHYGLFENIPVFATYILFFFMNNFKYFDPYYESTKLKA